MYTDITDNSRSSAPGNGGLPRFFPFRVGEGMRVVFVRQIALLR